MSPISGPARKRVCPGIHRAPHSSADTETTMRPNHPQDQSARTTLRSDGAWRAACRADSTNSSKPPGIKESFTTEIQSHRDSLRPLLPLCLWDFVVFRYSQCGSRCAQQRVRQAGLEQTLCANLNNHFKPCNNSRILTAVSVIGQRYRSAASTLGR